VRGSSDPSSDAMLRGLDPTPPKPAAERDGAPPRSEPQVDHVKEASGHFNRRAHLVK